MKKEIKIPQISEDADEATVAKVYVSEGDEIKKGDDLIAVESDKASVDIPNEEADGTVKEVKVSEGDTVKVGDVIIILEVEGDDSDSDDDPDSEQEDSGEGKKSEKKEKDAGSEGGEEDSDPDSDERKEEKDGDPDSDREVEKEREKEEGKEEDSEKDDEKAQEDADKKEEDEDEDPDSDRDGEGKEPDKKSKEKEDGEKKDKKKSKSDKEKDAEEDPDSDGDGDPAASAEGDSPSAPLAKKFARELGIDIKDLQGDGREERITREDVMDYARKLIQTGGGKKGAPGGVEPIELPDFSQWGDTEREPLSGIRMAVAKNTKLSWQNIPHVTQHDKADLTELQRFREKMAEKDRKLSITAIMAKICVAALEQFPRFNSSLDLENHELILKKYCNIGIAVDTDDGLLMPVIKNAEEKSLDDINKELKELAEKARDRKLKPEEMKGGNFTISNLGGIGGTSFTPVIFPPQVAILGMSKSAIEPVWIEDEFVPAEMTILSLSYDHRVIDGADAARFLRWICEVIEEPFNLLQ